MGAALDAAKRFFDLFQAGDLEGAQSVFADGCVTITPAGDFKNDEHVAFGRTFKDALPDAHMEVVRAVESGDEVFIEGRFKGTHKGDLVSPQGTVPASGNQLDVPFADWFKVDGGKIVEHRTFWDQMTMMAQLGAQPPQ